jgi:hypothetical protein
MNTITILISLFLISLMVLMYALIVLYLRGDREFLYTWLSSLATSLLIVWVAFT